MARGEPGVGSRSPPRWATRENVKLHDLSREAESPAAFLLRVTLRHPDAYTVVVGMKNPDHLAKYLWQAREGLLAPNVYVEAERRLPGARGGPSR